MSNPASSPPARTGSTMKSLRLPFLLLAAALLALASLLTAQQVMAQGDSEQQENRPPGFIHAIKRGVFENSSAGTNVGNPVTASDPDGDTVTYSLTGTGSDLFNIDAGGQITVGSGTALDHETTPKYFITVHADDGNGGTDSVPITINVKDVAEPPDNEPGEVSARQEEESNRPPEFIHAYKRGVFENSPAGTSVGVPVTASDPDGDTVTYSLTGTGSDLFNIDAGGQITVGSGTALDHETTPKYFITVHADDGNGGTDSVPITVNVKDVVEPTGVNSDVPVNSEPALPGKPGVPLVTRRESGAPSNPALDVNWASAPARGTTITGYEVRYGKPRERWTNLPGTLPATAGSANIPNLEPGVEYNVEVRAVASAGNDTVEGPWSSIGTGTTNRPPTTTDAVIADFTASPGSAFRSQGNLSGHFTDADSSDELRFSVTSEHPGIVRASIAGGHVVAQVLNPGASVITYGAHDAYGGYASRTFTVTGVANLTRSIPERSPAGTAVGAPVTGTPVNGEALTYALTGAAADSGLFVIDAATGQIKVAPGANLDYETASSYAGQVSWTAQGQSVSASVTINVTDLEIERVGMMAVTGREYKADVGPSLDVTWTPAPANGLTVTGYEVRYRKPRERWTPHTPVLPAGAVSVTLTGLEAGVSYEVEVRARGVAESEGGEGHGPWGLNTGSTLPAATLPAEYNAVPGKPGAPLVTRTESSEPSAPALDVAWAPAPAPSNREAAITDYVIHYRKPNEETWTDLVLPADAYSATLNGLEPGADYEVRVNAVVATFLVQGPWSAVWTGTTNRPPTTTDAAIADFTASPGSAFRSQGNLSGHFTDADSSDELRFSVTSEHPGIVRASIAGGHVVAQVLNPGASVITYGAHDAYGGYASRTFTVTGVANVTRSIPERSPAGTAVGAPVTGTPVNGEALTYALTGAVADSGLFVIDAATGQIKVAPGANLDYETASSYAGQVSWTAQGQSVSASVAINVTDLEIQRVGMMAVTGREYSPDVGPSLDVTWTPASANGLTVTGYEVRYLKPRSTHVYHPEILPATATSVNLPGLDPNAEYLVEVRARGVAESEGGEGHGPWGLNTGRTLPTATLSPVNVPEPEIGKLQNPPRRPTRWDMLAGLTLTDNRGNVVTFSPAFDSRVSGYEATVESSVTSITVTATLNTGNTIVRVYRHRMENDGQGDYGNYDKVDGNTVELYEPEVRSATSVGVAVSSSTIGGTGYTIFIQRTKSE